MIAMRRGAVMVSAATLRYVARVATDILVSCHGIAFLPSFHFQCVKDTVSPGNESTIPPALGLKHVPSDQEH